MISQVTRLALSSAAVSTFCAQAGAAWKTAAHTKAAATPARRALERVGARVPAKRVVILTAGGRGARCYFLTVNTRLFSRTGSLQ